MFQVLEVSIVNKALSNGQKRRIARWGFERITGLHDGDNVIGIDLREQELGTFQLVSLGGARRVQWDLEGPALPTALMIITPEGEVLIGQRPVLKFEEKPYLKFLGEFAPNGGKTQEPLTVITLDVGELISRRHWWHYMPGGVEINGRGQLVSTS